MPKREVYPGIIHSCSRRGNQSWQTWRGQFLFDDKVLGFIVEMHSYWKRKAWRQASDIEVHWWFDGTFRCKQRRQLSVSEMRAVINWVDYLIAQAVYDMPYTPTLRVRCQRGDDQVESRRRLYRRWGQRWAPYMEVVYDW